MRKEIPELTAKVSEEILSVDTSAYPGGRVPPRDIWRRVFGTEPNVRQVADLGRSLQALGWKRSYYCGHLVFIKEQ